MDDAEKTKDQLIQEIQALRLRMAELQKSESEKSMDSPSNRDLTLLAISNNLLSGMIYQIIRKDDGTRCFTYLSDAVQRFYGITPEQGMADSSLIYSQVHEEDRLRVFEEEEGANRTLTPFRSEVRMIDPRGGIRWSLFVSQPRRLADESICWDGIEFDITERKQVEEELKRSEEQFRRLFEDDLTGNFLTNPDGIILDCNPAFFKIFGYQDRSEVLNQNIRLLYQNESEWDDIISQFYVRSKLEGYEAIRKRKDGALIVVEENIAASFDEAGKLIEIRGYTYDITDRKRIKEALEASEKKFKAAFMTGLDAMSFTTLEEGRLLEVNEEFANFFGYTREEMIGRTSPELHLYADIKDRDRVVSELKRTGWIKDWEMMGQKKTGELFFGSMSVRVIELENKHYMLNVIRDITERKRAEELLKKSQGQLKHLSNRLITAQESEQKRIAIELHDDLGQSLIGLKFQLSSFQNRLRNDQTGLKNEIKQLADSVDLMTENVRRLSRNLRPSVLEHLGLIEALRWLFEDFSARHKIKITKKKTISDILFSKDQEIMVFRIFQEALTNIRKHAQATKVAIELNQEGRLAVFSIKDNGKGFNPKAFNRRSPSKKGLGLVAMAERAQMAGGTLEITSTPGKGTLITFSIPRKRTRKK